MVNPQQAQVFQADAHGLYRDPELGRELVGMRFKLLLEGLPHDFLDRPLAAILRALGPVLLSDVGVDDRLQAAEALGPRIEHALPGHQETGREIVGLPFDRCLLLAGAADHGRFGFTVGEHRCLPVGVSEVLPMQSPMADFVTNAEVVAAFHLGVLVRLQALVNEDFALVGPEGTEHIWEAEQRLQVVKVQGQAEVGLQYLVRGDRDLDRLTQLLEIGFEQTQRIALDLLLGQVLHVYGHCICISIYIRGAFHVLLRSLPLS